MANVLNRTSLEYLQSVNDPDYPDPPWLHNPDMTAVATVPSRYWKLTGDAVEEMTQAEKDAVDAAIAAALDADLTQAVKDDYDARKELKAVVLTVIDEVNILRAAVDTLTDELLAVGNGSANNISALKSELAALTDQTLPDRTVAQARTAIFNKVDGL